VRDTCLLADIVADMRLVKSKSELISIIFALVFSVPQPPEPNVPKPPSPSSLPSPAAPAPVKETKGKKCPPVSSPLPQPAAPTPVKEAKGKKRPPVSPDSPEHKQSWGGIMTRRRAERLRMMDEFEQDNLSWLDLNNGGEGEEMVAEEDGDGDGDGDGVENRSKTAAEEYTVEISCLAMSLRRPTGAYGGLREPTGAWGCLEVPSVYLGGTCWSLLEPEAI